MPLCSLRSNSQNDTDNMILFIKKFVHVENMHLRIYRLNSGEGVEKREPSYTVGGNAN